MRAYVFPTRRLWQIHFLDARPHLPVLGMQLQQEEERSGPVCQQLFHRAMRPQPIIIRKTPTHCCHTTVSLKKMTAMNIPSRKLMEDSG